MPYPNEHACRLVDPGEFQPDSFRRIQRGEGKDKLSIIIGKKRGADATSTQAYRYPKDTWDAERAAAHCKTEGGSFEQAKEETKEAVETVRKEGDRYCLYRSTPGHETEVIKCFDTKDEAFKMEAAIAISKAQRAKAAESVECCPMEQEPSYQALRTYLENYALLLPEVPSAVLASEVLLLRACLKVQQYNALAQGAYELLVDEMARRLAGQPQ